MLPKNKVSWKDRLQTLAVRAIIMAVIVSIVTAIVLYAMPGYVISKDEAVKAVKVEGYSDVVVTSRSVVFASGWFGQCKADDHAEFQVTARNRNGDEVALIVCGRITLAGTSFTTRTK